MDAHWIMLMMKISLAIRTANKAPNVLTISLMANVVKRGDRSF